MYQSPIRLTGFTGLQEQQSPRSALLLARRKLEAEFELSGSSTITYEGRELNRQDVIRLFDELRDEERLAWHMAIYADEVLLRFLEEGRLGPGREWAPNPVYGDSRFILFVSPYFAEAIDVFYRKLLAGEVPLSALQTLAGNAPLMVSRDADRAFRHVTRYFLEKKNELMRLQQRAEASEAVLRQEVRDAVPDEALTVLNYLPDAYDDLRYQMANALNNLCVAFDQKAYKRHALIAIEKAVLVAVEDEELQALIPRNLNIIRSKQTGSFYRIDEHGKKQLKWGWIAGVALLLIRILAWLGQSNENHDIDIRYPVSFNTVTTSAFQPQPRQTFNSLVSALVSGEPDSLRFKMAGNTYALAAPQQTGEAVFPALISGELGTNADTAKAPRRSSLLQVRNRSGWHLLLCYVLDNQSFGIRYVAPGKDYSLGYTADTLEAVLVAGKGWNAGRRAIFNHASSVMTEIRSFTGGYTDHPGNMHDLVDADGTPLFRRADTSGAKHRDVLEVADSIGNTISVRQG